MGHVYGTAWIQVKKILSGIIFFLPRCSPTPSSLRRRLSAVLSHHAQIISAVPSHNLPPAPLFHTPPPHDCCQLRRLSPLFVIFHCRLRRTPTPLPSLLAWSLLPLPRRSPPTATLGPCNALLVATSPAPFLDNMLVPLPSLPDCLKPHCLLCACPISVRLKPYRHPRISLMSHKSTPGRHH